MKNCIALFVLLLVEKGQSALYVTNKHRKQLFANCINPTFIQNGIKTKISKTQTQKCHFFKSF